MSTQGFEGTGKPVQADPAGGALQRDGSGPEPAMMPQLLGELEPAPLPDWLHRLRGSLTAGRVAAAVAGLLLLGAVIVGGVSISGTPWGGGASSSNTTTTVNASSPIQPVPPAEIGRAVGLLMMSAADKSKVQDAVKSGKMKIGFVTVTDSDAEDGDWVSVTAGGFRQDVRLFKKPLTVAVPYLPGQTVRVTGLVDGDGGGITVAVHIGTNIVGLKPLRVGESVEVATP